MAAFPSRVKLEVPICAGRLANYKGFDLYFDYVEHAKYSARSIGYVYATWRPTRRVAFVQASGVRHEVVGSLDAGEIARRLRTDAIRRAKNRIDDRSFAIGEVYTIELDELSVKNLVGQGARKRPPAI